MEVIRAARRFPTRTAVVAANRVFSYGDLLEQAGRLAEGVRAALTGSGADTANAAAPAAAAGASPPRKAARTEEAPAAGGLMAGPRVGVMAQPGPEYVAAMWSAWLSGSVAVPLALSHPPAELSYVLRDAGITVVLATDEFAQLLAPLATECGAQVLRVPEFTPSQPGAAAATAAAPPAADAEPDAASGALIIYTSGTTGRPKGALHTHGSLQAQIASLVGAWEWAAGDRIVHPLPLHHIHGIVNALLCPHAVGAAVEFVPKFSPGGLWARLRAGADGAAPPVTVFMGVPTMYVRLLQALEAMEAPADRTAAAKAAAGLRLTVSGSAACPVPLMTAWEGVTGQRLLERYGMTEVGMALSNPLHGERRPGFVGVPLPGVRIKVVPDAATAADASAPAAAEEEDGGAAPAAAAATGPDYGPVEEGPGELRVAGPAMFAGYWGKPDATASSYDAEGFFCTGDTVVRQGGSWRILGRTSVDIIKCGGYKLSALEIEAHLLEHPAIGEAAVVGLPDEAYGQVVAAVLAPKAAGTPPPALAELRVWARDVMAPYKVPTQLRTVEAIPRNAMGKVNKKELAKMFDKPAEKA